MFHRSSLLMNSAWTSIGAYIVVVVVVVVAAAVVVVVVVVRSRSRSKSGSGSSSSSSSSVAVVAVVAVALAVAAVVVVAVVAAAVVRTDKVIAFQGAWGRGLLCEAESGRDGATCFRLRLERVRPGKLDLEIRDRGIPLVFLGRMSHFCYGSKGA